MVMRCLCSFFFFTDTATPEIYTLSLHDALPISIRTRRARRSRFFLTARARGAAGRKMIPAARWKFYFPTAARRRSEEHTSELQSHVNLVCRLLLEKKKKNNPNHTHKIIEAENIR